MPSLSSSAAETLWPADRRGGALPVLGLVGLALALAMTLALAPLLAVGAVVGGGLFVLLMTRPYIVLAGTLIFGPVDLSFLTGGYKALFESAGGLDMNGIRLVVLVVGFSLMILLDRRMLRLTISRPARWYTLLIALGAVSLSYSTSPLDGARFLFKLAFPLLIFLAVLHHVRDRETLDRLGNLILASAAFLAVVANPVYLLFGDSFIADPTLGPRARGLGLHTGPWSYYLLIVSGMCLVRYATRRQLRYLLLAVICGFWVVSTLTRTAAVASVVALGLLAVYSGFAKRNLRLSAAAVVVGGGVGLFLWSSFVQKTFGGHFPGPSEWIWLLRNPAQYAQVIQVSGREVLWAVAYASFAGAPLLGTGLGSTTALLQSRFPAEVGHVVHNEYLRLAAEAGLVGLGLFIMALYGWWRAARHSARINSTLTMEWALPAMVALVVWAVTCLADNSIDYYAPVAQYVGFLTAGAIIAARLSEPAPEPDA